MARARQLGRPPSTTSGRIAVVISEAMKLRASIFSLRHRIPLGQMVEEGLRLFMREHGEGSADRAHRAVKRPEQEPKPPVSGRAPVVHDQEV